MITSAQKALSEGLNNCFEGMGHRLIIFPFQLRKSDSHFLKFFCPLIAYHKSEFSRENRNILGILNKKVGNTLNKMDAKELQVFRRSGFWTFSLGITSRKTEV